jgi:hypothetical protein
MGTMMEMTIRIWIQSREARRAACIQELGYFIVKQPKAFSQFGRLRDWFPI